MNTDKNGGDKGLSFTFFAKTTLSPQRMHGLANRISGGFRILLVFFWSALPCDLRETPPRVMQLFPFDNVLLSVPLTWLPTSIAAQQNVKEPLNFALCHRRRFFRTLAGSQL